MGSEKLQTDSMAEPSKEMREAIALLVARYGCTVKVPVRWQAGSTSLDTAEALDKTWNPLGVRVHLATSSSHFARRVYEARRQHGMPALPTWEDYVIFEPDETDPYVKPVQVAR